jgi:peptidoglycan/xylan/chitin deacetylase (PgdA/CDA1 family)
VFVPVTIAAHAALLLVLLRVPALTAAVLASYAVYHAVLAWAVCHPRSRLLGPNRSRLDTREKVVALTFDDGPHPTLTPRVLDILREHRAKATFFLIGREATHHPDVARRIADEGHEIGNHTSRHSYLFWANPPGRLRAEVQRAQEEIATASGTTCRLFRCPVGLKSPFLAGALAKQGLALVSWSIRIPCEAGTDPAKVARRLKHLRPGSILLLHDGHDRRPEGRPGVVQVLPLVLRQLESAGYRCVGLERA